MKVPAKARWISYAIAAILTVAAMWRLDRDKGDVVDVAAPARSAPRPNPKAADRAPAATDDALARLKQQIDTALGGSGVDPFRDSPSAAEVQANAAAQASAMRQAAAAAAAAPPPAPPPPPPFRYLGRWQEQGRTRVFLQSGDRVFQVVGLGPLDGTATVVSLGADHVTLKLPDGRRHTLSFAPDTAAPTSGAGPAGATPFNSGASTTEEN